MSKVSTKYIERCCLNEEAFVKLVRKYSKFKHKCIIIFDNKIKDLGSQNGTYINEQREQMATFREKDSVKVGETILNFSMLPEDF